MAGRKPLVRARARVFVFVCVCVYVCVCVCVCVRERERERGGGGERASERVNERVCIRAFVCVRASARYCICKTVGEWGSGFWSHIHFICDAYKQLVALYFYWPPPPFLLPSFSLFTCLFTFSFLQKLSLRCLPKLPTEKQTPGVTEHVSQYC